MKPGKRCDSCNAWWRDFMTENSLLIYVLIITCLFLLTSIIEPCGSGVR